MHIVIFLQTVYPYIQLFELQVCSLKSVIHTNRAKLTYSAIMPINVFLNSEVFATVLQAYLIFLFICLYVIPVSVFAYCYGRIFHTIRRQSNVVRSQASRSHDIPMATTSS